MEKPDETKSLLEKYVAAYLNKGLRDGDKSKKSLTEEEVNQIASEVTEVERIDKFSERSINIDVDKKWSKISKDKKGGNTFNWMHIAASILILVSVLVFVNKKDEINIEIVDTNIETGTDKATLTLESGKEVTLIKGASFQTLNANSNGEKIVYLPTGQAGNTGDSPTKETAYNYLTIPRGGQFQLTLSDSTQVWLNSETQLKYPVAFIEGQPRQVELLYGEAYFDVSPSTKHNGAKFKVIHQAQEIEVLGTEFNIKAYKDETNIYTTLVEGKISLDTPENEKIILKPKDQANLNLNSNTIKTTLVDVYNETSWKKGIFSFRGKTLEEIMRVLSRWYDVDVIFADEKLKSVLFDGVLGKDENITTLLKSIKTANFINTYDIDKKTITLQ